MRSQILRIIPAGFLAVMGLIAFNAHAQNFPSQQVRLISPFPAGSGPDVVARIVGERLAATWKQPVIIDPRPGANGFLALGAGKQAAPTGYDLVVADAGHLAVNPSLFRNLPYDPKTDFVPVGAFYRNPFFIVVGANSAIRNIKDLAAAAAVAPGKVTYGSNAVGGPLHLGGALVETATGTKMLHVPYKEISQLYLAVSTGEVDWAMASLASAGPLLKAGKLRLIAVADTKRLDAAPAVPTFEEAGGAKPLVVRGWVAVMAPRGTPASAVATLNRDINEALKQPSVAEKLNGFGFEPYVLTPSAISALIASETVFYADVVKRTGASAD